MRIAIVDDLSTDSEALQEAPLPLGIGTGEFLWFLPLLYWKVARLCLPISLRMPLI